MTATNSSNPLVRFLNLNTSGEKGGRSLPLWRQLLLQVICLAIAAEVLFPIMYVVTMAFSSQTSRPSSLQLIPTEFSLVAFKQVLDHPTANPVSFLELLRNSFLLSFGVGLAALLVAVSAAYAFSRFKFRLRQVLMILVFVPLLMPVVGLSTPLYLLMNSIRIMDQGRVIFNLRDSLLGVGIAITAGALPFAVWNLKGYLDTIPKDLEEAAAVDGADVHQTFLRIILPLSLPALAVTGFLGFIAGWTEFYFTSTFLSGSVPNHTLALALYAMVGQFSSTPWSAFSAFAILFAVPPALVYFVAQRWITSGLAIGAVKG